MRISLHFPFNNAQESHVSSGFFTDDSGVYGVRETTAELKKIEESCKGHLSIPFMKTRDATVQQLK